MLSCASRIAGSADIGNEFSNTLWRMLLYGEERNVKKNIFLIGFMGAGKTTVARYMRDSFGMELIEMDEQIEAEQGKKISEIFAEQGEEYFRALETELLRSLEHKENTVVSCGGGVPMRQVNVDHMSKSGAVVYLSARPETIYDRVRDSHTRPLLEGHMEIPYIDSLMKKRLPAYLSAAHLTVETDGRTAEEICKEIMERMGE